MSHQPRHRRTPDQRRRRWGGTGTGVGIAVGGAMAAAFVATGTASADDDAAALAQPIDLAALTAASIPSDTAAAAAAALPAPADSFENLVQTIDPNAFTAAGVPNDFLGQLASQIDSDLAKTVFGPELNTIATQILAGQSTWAAATTTDEDGFADLAAFFTQSSLGPFGAWLDPLVGQTASGAPNDFLGQFADQVDAMLAPTVFGPEVDTIADQIIAAFTTTAF